MPTGEICFTSATELALRIRRREISAVEVMRAHLAQIEQINPQVNAIVTCVPEQALQGARAADRGLAPGGAVAPLYGLPVAHKDLVLTSGVRTTFGSPIFKDLVPVEDALIVERFKSAGAIMVGKTNTPEFGAGSQTFNPVFGATRNPYDLTKTSGGSSGGAAAALACGMIPIADGSDLGGSLRNPASFCNVVGFRPSPGRVPSWPTEAAWFPLSVEGPMARSVTDVALILTAIAGPDPRSPIAIEQPGSIFAKPLERDFAGTRIAWCGDLGGRFPVDPRVTAAVDAQRQVFESLGCELDNAAPDFSDADEVFHVWRAWKMELQYGRLLAAHRPQIKDTVIWNIEQGQALAGPRVAAADRKRTALYHRVRTFMQSREFLVLPVSQVPPFDVTQPYVTEINGVNMNTYIDWMKSCYYISTIGLPAISVPCGFTSDGLPVGLQIVGRHHADFQVLQLAYAFEQATGFARRRPALCG
jgi:amidase